jgi:hypothetical protein
MRAFTDAQKEQLQTKIENEQERQRALRESIQIEKEKESKRRKGIISTALSYKYGMLGFIFFLIILNIRLLLPRQNYDSHIYLLPMITLMLLFNHIAYHFTKKGWLNRVMKIVAWTWIMFVWAYILWIFWIRIA